MITVAFVSVIIREQTIGQTVRCSMLDDTSTAPSMIWTGDLRTDTFLYIRAAHVILLSLMETSLLFYLLSELRTA